MASSRVPKLVIKRHKPTRRLKLPKEMTAEQRKEAESVRARRISRATVAVKQAKKSLRSHGYLMVVGLCAAIVMYGVASTLASSSEGSSSSQNGEQDVNSAAGVEMRSADSERKPAYVEHRDKTDPEIIIRITTNPDGTKVERFREIKVIGSDGAASGRILMPIKPEKPKPFMPTDKKEDIIRSGGGTIPQ
jgi:hypothetical protein